MQKIDNLCKKKTRGKKKERERLENELTELKSNLSGTESAIKSVEMDIDGMVQRQQGNTSPTTSDEEGDDWLDWNLQDTRTTLYGLQDHKQKIISKISNMEDILKTLK